MRLEHEPFNQVEPHIKQLLAGCHFFKISVNPGFKIFLSIWRICVILDSQHFIANGRILFE